jgi:uncharacterized protein (UPF0332 family)
MIARARDCLRIGVRDVAEANPERAASSAYYAVFHAMTAALASQGLSYSKHSGVMAGFNQHFLKPEVFPRAFFPLIERLFAARIVGDYSYVETVSADEAARGLADAEMIVNAIAVYLTEAGLLPQ